MSKKSRPSDSDDSSPDQQGEEANHRGERLQKVLAAAGIASRRECEELIVSGRVEVDKRIITELGTRVDPVRNEIRVDGVALHRPKLVYYLLNKPVGVVCTNYDPAGRTRVIDLINTDERIFPVGRLDRSSEGLILVTNDGTLANRLTHPRYGVEKTYLAHAEGHPTPPTLERLREGVHLAEGTARVADIRFKRRHPTTSELIIVLKEGRNREIRRILARVGHKVLRLKRIAIGPIKIEDLPTGGYRKLTFPEVQALEKSVQQARKAAKKGRKPSGKSRRFSSSSPTSNLENRPERPTSQKPPQIKPQRKFEDDDDFGGDDDDFIPISEADFASDFSDDDAAYPMPSRQGKVLGAEDEGGAFTPPKPSGPRRVSRTPTRNPLSEKNTRAAGKKEFGKKEFGKKPFGKKPFGKKPVGKKPFAKQSSEGSAERGPLAAEVGRSQGRSQRRPARGPEGRAQGKKFGKPKKRGRR